MARREDEDHALSRRIFLKRMRWAPMLFLPAPLPATALRPLLAGTSGGRNSGLDLADFRVSPHYP
ncbi:MAG: hypothetical protein WA299_18555, partial [Candidatus Acidiferrum sp.]